MSRRRHQAFSLIEILVVIGLITVLGTFSLIAIREVREASALRADAGNLVDNLNLARQMAQTRNQPVEIRFYEMPNSASSSENDWRGFQLFLIEEGSARPLDRVITFSPQIKVAPESVYSNLLDQNRTDLNTGTGAETGHPLPGIGIAYRYRGFRFQPDGSTTLAASVFLTIKPSNAPALANAPASNWYSIHVDATHGAVRTFQP